jgi:hypothetical protein
MHRGQAKLLTKGDLVHCGPVPSSIPARLQPCLALVVTRVRLKWRSSGVGVRSWAGTEVLEWVESAEVGNNHALHYFHPGSTLKHLHLASACKRASTLEGHPEAFAVKYPSASLASLVASS